MKIDNDQSAVVVNISLVDFRQRQPAEPFSSVLSAEGLKAENEAARNEILASQQPAKEDANKDDLEFIREYGLRAYAEEVHKQKIEELREKLLQALGLSEEALADMPADQRIAIEDMISQEIQKRLAANSLTNGGSEPNEKGLTSKSVGAIDPENLLAAQIVTDNSGSLIGLAVSEATQSNELPERPDASEDDR